MSIEKVKEWIKVYDQSFLSGFKTYITIGVMVWAVTVIPESKLSYFVSLLSAGHMAGLRFAKS